MKSLDAARQLVAHLKNGLDSVIKLGAQDHAQGLLLLCLRQDSIIHGSNAHVTLGQDHLYQVNGALEEGPLLVHLLQLCLVPLQVMCRLSL